MITVLTCTYRETDRLKAMAESLARQSHQDFEWVIVDDLYEQRKEEVYDLPIPRLRHMPPRNGVKEGNAWSSAMNTGILHAQGELLHFMADSVVLTKDVLARHWEIYQTYGPKVLISGKYIIKADDQLVEFGPRSFGARNLGDGVGEVRDPALLGKWFWASKNDSAPTEMAIAVNGCDEQFDGYLGGMDVIFAARMRALGCRWLFDTKAPAFEAFGHIDYKDNDGDLPGWQGMFWKAIAGDTWAPNGWSIREERERLCVSL